MAPQPRWQLLLLFLAFLSTALAASPTSFCKCTCFTNSTIIPLDSERSSETVADPEPRDILWSRDSSARLTCNDCNKQFCLDYDLSICKEAKEEDVFTTCFQRDSTKDELIVFLFIFTTVGLLGWAGIKPWVQKWRERRSRGAYASVGN
ncbi:hypothetical protein K431DRAFT_291246 [Polychaeton citri CBS 116435]|uniref:Uncharacterized protein n=1 Tax=Polychaeton citri CBS 116435 TaxID=1314669 RepID=A0A9P4USI7_9PEZI|nr:hypothetical protein K431DRAFT_291246 [Polychaeton citri CBS 116435]